MTTLVLLLRGINVGGRSRLGMADLRAIARDAGFDDVRTHIQSGNLVATSDLAAGAAADTLAAAIAEATDLTPAVLARTADEMQAVIDDSPFLARGADPAHLHVTFVDGDASEALAEVDLESFAPERAEAVGRELHMLLPGGIGRSRLATTLSRHPSGGQGTTRNWRTVTKLVELAAETARR